MLTIQWTSTRFLFNFCSYGDQCCCPYQYFIGDVVQQADLIIKHKNQKNTSRYNFTDRCYNWHAIQWNITNAFVYWIAIIKIPHVLLSMRPISFWIAEQTIPSERVQTKTLHWELMHTINTFNKAAVKQTFKINSDKLDVRYYWIYNLNCLTCLHALWNVICTCLERQEKQSEKEILLTIIIIHNKFEDKNVFS